MFSDPEAGSSTIDAGIGELAALVGHELNNIGVPLDGFAEIALQSLAAKSPARQYLEEMRLGIARVQALAHQLEILGESEANPDRIAIGDCMPDVEERSSYGSWTIEWACNSGSAVRVDRLHARRAIHSLLDAVWKASPPGVVASVLTVSHGLPSEAECATCLAVCKYGRNDIRVQPDNPRRVTLAALRAPLRSAGAGRTGQRLSLAILVHCAHRAGGHVLHDERTGSLSLAFHGA